jgi:hypothetical protein
MTHQPAPELEHSRTADLTPLLGTHLGLHNTRHQGLIKMRITVLIQGQEYALINSCTWADVLNGTLERPRQAPNWRHTMANDRGVALAQQTQL